MIETRCQVCGRRKAITGRSRIVHHHYRGGLCFGAGEYPAGEDCSALEKAERYWRGLDASYLARWQDHRGRRLNESLGADFFAAWAAASREGLRIAGRRKRLGFAMLQIAA